MKMPFDPGEVLMGLTAPCVAFAMGESEPWLNSSAQKLFSENPELINDLARATVSGEIHSSRVVDLVAIGEVNRFLFEPVKTSSEMTFWIGWNAHEALFSCGMEMTQVIARKLSHEIRNPLQPIQIITDHWQEAHPEFASDATIVNKQIGRILKVVGNLRGFLDSRPLEVKPIELNDLLGHLTERLRKLAPSNISWSIYRMTGKIMIAGEVYRLEKAFESLFRNSLEAMSERGCLQIATGISGSTGKGGVRAFVEISDSGTGIPAEAMSKLFIPFFSTKPEGVGLGLALARRIFALHRGDLKLASQEGIGTTATVALPTIGRV